MSDCKIRFANNNYLDSTATHSTFDTSYPFANVYDTRRGVVGVFRGNFTITASVNDKIYINDGTDKTITLTAAEYTGTTLASHIQTQLNASSTNWTCTYSTTTYLFTINRTSGTAVLRFSQTTAAAWDTLGFVGTTDDSTPSFVSDESRIHSEEWIKIDIGVSQEIGFVGIVAPISEAFGISETATVKIEGNSIDDFTAPPTSVSLQVSDLGAFAYPDVSYRFWRLSIKDRQNPGGPSAIRIGYLSISSIVAVGNSSIATGFQAGYVDPSILLVSENGTRYHDLRQKYFTLTGEIQGTFGDSRRDLEQFFYDYGTSEPFFMSIDAGLKVFENQGEVTKLVRFESQPSLQNVIRDIFNVSLSVSEVV